MLIEVHWIPVAINSPLVGIPSLLLGYFESNGAWKLMLLNALSLIISTAIYYPFLKNDYEVQEKL
ncbi:hypothetical protein [Lactiplantibacillus plantarum]|uniref:hypothetical protein n=1 Tax=Lactiplantibacillus plantarum TaxID=1590 RepID=UPI00155E293F|nr:hypothetical protein [Lactiplantibacillus plantarum]MCG0680036.1 hypothetical protein [Lactiplantibacillus plantarum]